jgi:hypothetical protein
MIKVLGFDWCLLESEIEIWKIRESAFGLGNQV